MMATLEKRAADYKAQAMNLGVLGKNREALQKISVAIETNPAVADFHVHRYNYVQLCWLQKRPQIE